MRRKGKCRRFESGFAEEKRLDNINRNVDTVIIGRRGRSFLEKYLLQHRHNGEGIDTVHNVNICSWNAPQMSSPLIFFLFPVSVVAA
jgi:hypothetical protein